MRKQQDWHKLLQIEPAYLDLENQILSGAIQDYREIPPQSFSWHAWDLIPEERLFTLLLPFLRQQLSRAKLAMGGLYSESLSKIHPEDLRSREDWFKVPVSVKDDHPEYGIKGFRQSVRDNPGLLRPADLATACVSFGSGGSLGKHTPTFVTESDRQREVQAWRRGHDYHGLVEGDTALYTYNTTHKGGQWMQESLWSHGVDVCLRRPEEGPEAVLENIRDYDVNILFTVQQPHEFLNSQEKASGINLHALVLASLENPQYHGLLLPNENGDVQVQFIFLGGFEIVPYAMELINTYLPNTPVATLLGSSEAIPQACSTNPKLTPTSPCHFNNLHLLQSPHYVEILKPHEEDWIPLDPGEQGLLVYTSWARDGTIWLRYAPGDVATLLLPEGECPCGLHSPVITDVHRKITQQNEDLLLHGCAAG